MRKQITVEVERWEHAIWIEWVLAIPRARAQLIDAGQRLSRLTDAERPDVLDIFFDELRDMEATLDYDLARWRAKNVPPL